MIWFTLCQHDEVHQRTGAKNKMPTSSQSRAIVVIPLLAIKQNTGILKSGKAQNGIFGKNAD